jgi:NAD(P)-dependent dehydrogenase (short-subunit alcohol dehydrogenase family)
MTATISLEGKVAIVTGASRGIGEAVARAFVAHGAKVVIASRKLEGLTPVAEALAATERGAGSVLPVAAHTGKEEDCRALVAKAVEKFGKVDVLVNNAATNPYFGPMLDIDGGAWDKTFEVNLKGYFWMAREVAKHLQKRGAPGSIVNVASVAALEAAPMQGVYGMTKAAIVSMTKTLAFELGGSRIRVNAVAPGLVETKFAGALITNDSIVDHVVKKTPLGRYAQPDEIAGGVMYLASDAAGFLTGHTLVIDGGMTIC